MHKKHKVHGHVVHKLPRCINLYYTVEPEHSCIAVYILRYDEAIGEHCYAEFEDISICTKNLGRHGYLAEQIEWISRRHSDIVPIRNYLEHNKLINDDLKALNNTIFKEEKKMTEYYVIDIELTDGDLETKRTTCLQIRQKGNYFEIPFDGPDISEYRLDRLERCLNDYILETKKFSYVRLIKSEICNNSILEISTPYDDISDDANREELCKMLTYAAEHNEYPSPASKVGLSKICFFLRECNNHEIHRKVYSDGIDCVIRLSGKVARYSSYCDYIQEPTDVVRLRFKNGRLATFVLAGDPIHELEAELYNIPAALYDIYNPGKPFQNVEEVKSLLLAIHTKRTMWKNASYITFAVFNNHD